MEVHRTQKWVWDYENSEEDKTQIVDRAATEPKDDDDTKDDEDMNNRVVLSRVVLTTGPSLDLDNVIAKIDVQCQNIPFNKTYETGPTGNTRAGDTGVSETGQMIGAYGMDGNTVTIQHGTRE